MRRPLPAHVLRTSHHLLAAMPFLLGFRPQSSAVLVWLNGSSIGLTQRVDWPQADAQRPGATSLEAWAHAVVHSARHVTSDAAILLGYPAALQDPDACAQPLRTLAAHVQSAGVEVQQVLLVDEDRWWRIDPDFGELSLAPVDLDPAICAEVAEDFASSGWRYAASREEVRAELDGDPELQALTARALARVWGDSSTLHERDLEQWRDHRILALRSLLAAGLVDADAAAHLALGLSDIRVRDCMLWDLAQLANPGARLPMLIALVRALPDGHRAPAGTLAAICAWLGGDGVRAAEALAVAQREDPDYGLAVLVGTALVNGLPPSMWAQTMERLSFESCRHGLR